MDYDMWKKHHRKWDKTTYKYNIPFELVKDEFKSVDI